MHALTFLYYVILLSVWNTNALPIGNLQSRMNRKDKFSLARLFKSRDAPARAPRPDGPDQGSTTSSAVNGTVVPVAPLVDTISSNNTSSSHLGINSTAGSLNPANSANSSVSSSSAGKIVVAHMMVGNTFPYKVADWTKDINLAHSYGIDGFALNVGSDSWQPGHVDDAYTAAQQSGTGFKLFMSFDMSVLPCASPDDAATLRKYITTYANHPNQLKYDNRVFASTFAGESCKFGQGSVPEGWSSQFTQHSELTGENAVYFAPSFFVDPSTFSTFAGVMDGDFNFNSGWPIQVTTSFATSALSSIGAALNNLATNLAAKAKMLSFVGATDTDAQHITALASMPVLKSGGKRAYMAAVSPWFFTHYGKDSFNKNFIYLSDDHLYSKRWENLIAERDKIDLVEVVTWNDYGESHYIGPIEGAQPNSQAWVDGFDHTGWLQLTKHYATAFKTGREPAVEKDQLVMWARPHAANATTSDPIGPPENSQITQDTLWAVALATQPATVTLSTSPTFSQSFPVQAGVNKLQIPLQPGGSMRGTIQRNGQTVVDLKPGNYTFEANPKAYNFNAFVVASPA